MGGECHFGVSAAGISFSSKNSKNLSAIIDGNGNLPEIIGQSPLFSILRSGYFYLDSYHEEHPRVFATNIRYRIMSLAWMETYGVS